MQLSHEAKSSDTAVETSVTTNGAADDAIDNTKDDDDARASAGPRAASEDSPSAGADEDSADVIDDDAMLRVSTDVIQLLATLLADRWLELATQLGFQQDDISYIQTEHTSDTTRAANMLTLWAVSFSSLHTSQ